MGPNHYYQVIYLNAPITSIHEDLAPSTEPLGIHSCFIRTIDTLLPREQLQVYETEEESLVAA